MCVRAGAVALETPAMPPLINPLKAEVGLSIEFLPRSKYTASLLQRSAGLGQWFLFIATTMLNTQIHSESQVEAVATVL
jgi:hypothetical protein